MTRYGGSFAPPLTTAKIAVYRLLAASAEPQVGEVMLKLCKMVEVFQQTPASSLPGTPHPSGRGTMIPLSPGEIKRIWDDVPWDHECDMYAALFEPLDSAAAMRNSEKIGAWNRAVIAHITTKHFHGPTTYERATEALRSAAAWAGLMTVDQEAKVVELQQQSAACQAELQDVLTNKQHSLIPYPTLESTATRDAAYHLLWYAKELERDHEPVTNDKL